MVRLKGKKLKILDQEEILVNKREWIGFNSTLRNWRYKQGLNKI